MKRHEYYYIADKTRKGPFSYSEIIDINLPQDTLVWREGLKGWTKYSDIKDFNQHSPKANIKIPEPIKFIGIFILAITISGFIGSKIYLNTREDKINQLIREASFDTEEDLSIYVDKFYRDLECVGIIKTRPANCIVKFSNMQQFEETADIHGISLGYEQTDKIEIYINHESWKKFTKGQKYWLMYHELAHDILDLDDLSPDEANMGKLMYPIVYRFAPIPMDTFIEAFHQMEAEYLGVNSIF